MNYSQTQRGIALISVLFIAVAVMILALTFSRMVVSESQAAGSSRTMNESLQIADGVSERARLTVVDEFEKSFMTADKFLKAVDDGTLSTLDDTTVYSETVGGVQGYWKVNRIQTGTAPWIEVAATAETPKGVQTVLRRIGMGQSAIFDLAMLSERTDCMYCHLRVRGDVGQLYKMRPGWGTDRGGVAPSNGWADGWGSGKTSVIHGNAYAARDVSNDNTDLNGNPDKINGAEFDDVFTDYRGDKLPQDQDGDDIPDFPAIDRKVADASADGRLSGGVIYRVPNSGKFMPTLSPDASLSKTYDGNLVIEGTKDNPIILDKDVYISGDVVIKGYVKGRGAIYAGRNVYIAGNIKYIDENSDCWDEKVYTDPDQCARQDITNNKTELRLAARGNVIVGDYTEKKADGSSKAWADLQSADYYRAQFGFNGTDKKYYDKTNGDELSCDDSGAQCKNVDGEAVSGLKVIPVPAKDAYSYSLRPGEIKNGSFSSWLDDDVYQKILGKETRPYNTWRYDVANAGKTRSSLTLDDLKAQFQPYLASSLADSDKLSEASLEAMRCSTCSDGTFTLKTNGGSTIGSVRWSSNTMRVIMDPATEVEKQVTRIDAFVYANQRIAGKTFLSPLVVNGGLIAKDIGVLAPGLRKQGWMPDRYNFLNDIDCTSETSASTHNLKDVAHDEDADDCALTINYDYRMRNGGLGFNLVEGGIGQTVGWQIASRRSQHVTGP